MLNLRAATDIIHIPPGIRFECSGCANCCLSWPVPLTDEDRVRLDTQSMRRLGTAGAELFRALPEPQKSGTMAFSLQKGADGRCPFLSQENRCRIHEEFGIDAKPSMCQLFPHTFSLTPSGVYASVSFASTAVLYNSGRLLSEQEDLLKDRLSLFRRLFPAVAAKPGWNDLRWLDTVPASWNEFLALDALLQERVQQALSPAGLSRVSDLVCELSELVVSKLPGRADPEAMLPLESSPEIVDGLLLTHLNDYYFPSDPFAGGGQFDARALMQAIVAAPQEVSLRFDNQGISLSDLGTLGSFGADTRQINDLLTRFFFCRLFAKLYFASGLAGFSIVSGFHHLCLLVVLLQVRMKAHMKIHGDISFPQAAEYVRELERRLTFLNLSPQATAVLEILCASSRRIKRVTKLAGT